jgi:hypothetical protein
MSVDDSSAVVDTATMDGADIIVAIIWATEESTAQLSYTALSEGGCQRRVEK